jgi:hypothetical protein
MTILKRSNDEGNLTMESNTDELFQKAGVVAEVALQGQANRLRKAHPELSEAQAFARVYEAPENVELRRAELMKNGFHNGYAKRAPDDFSEAGQVDFTKGESKQWAFNELQRQATELNKREPHLTHSQCFARVYSSPDSLDLRKAERAANRPDYPAATGWRGPLPPVARTEPAVEQNLAYGALQDLADELKQKNPWLSDAQCFARVMEAPANMDLVRREREASRRLLGVEV